MKSNRVAPAKQVVTAQPGRKAVNTQQYAGQSGQQAMYRGITANAQSPKAVRMPKPATGAPNCPPGLAYLAGIDQILIKQRIELIELISNFEGLNSYRLLNSVGQQIYFAAEESEDCMRQCCRQNRSFTMHITDNLDHEVIRLQREFRCWQESNWCAFSDSCAHKIAVEAPVGTVIGYVQQRQSFKTPKYKIMDADEKDIFFIEGPCCVCECCRDEVNFKSVAIDNLLRTVY
ncbi:phospholipid scramblase 2-like [Ruditapes philippinarum]|uniref:phospholipid scramblase 2-like n=1 Tax=Ruditapes philippinarum TaxID=129788 RepID=UPI00295BE8AA|nr:phospholipid scramblase 2-like [Ruditapes philippinarum]